MSENVGKTILKQGKSLVEFFKSLPSCLSQLRLKDMIIFLAVVIILLGGYLNKDWLVVAIVNNQPIWRWQYSQQLNETYGEQVLNQMVDRRIIQQKIRQEGIEVSEAEIEEEITAIKEQWGEELLEQQGVNLDEIRGDLEMNIATEKILAEGLEITAEEIDEFIAENGDQLSGETEEERVTEVTEILRQQKLNEKASGWYEDIKNEANINYFLTF